MSVFAPGCPTRGYQAGGYFALADPPRQFWVGTFGPPRFLANPCVPLPRPWTPSGLQHLAFSMRKCCPRCPEDEGSRDETHFEARSRGFGTGCLRFVGCIATPPRKTRFRLLAQLCRVGLIPTGFERKVSVMFPTSFPLPQALPGAAGLPPWATYGRPHPGAQNQASTGEDSGPKPSFGPGPILNL